MALKSKSMDDVRADVPLAAAASGELVRVNLNVPKSKRDLWKTLAIQKDMTLAALIEDAMNSKYPKG